MLVVVMAVVVVLWLKSPYQYMLCKRCRCSYCSNNPAFSGVTDDLDVCVEIYCVLLPLFSFSTSLKSNPAVVVGLAIIRSILTFQCCRGHMFLLTVSRLTAVGLMNLQVMSST